MRKSRTMGLSSDLVIMNERVSVCNMPVCILGERGDIQRQLLFLPKNIQSHLSTTREEMKSDSEH